MPSKLLVAIAIALAFPLHAQLPAAGTLLDKTIQYHDPNGQWGTFNHKLTFLSERPSGPTRNSKVAIDNNKGYFKYMEEGNEMGVVMDSCFLVPQGKTCDNVKRTRNYYIYLWGLPMKLKDPGTVIDEKVKEENFNGTDCFVIRVPYEQDIWYFYLDKKNFALRGYLFYKDELAKKGEIIYLDEEMTIGNMRIPKKRKWVTAPDGKLLGTDILVSSDK